MSFEAVFLHTRTVFSKKNDFFLVEGVDFL